MIRPPPSSPPSPYTPPFRPQQAGRPPGPAARGRHPTGRRDVVVEAAVLVVGDQQHAPLEDLWVGAQRLVDGGDEGLAAGERSEEHTSELRHLVISYAVFCLI